MSAIVRYMWTVTGLRPSTDGPVGYGAVRYVRETDYDALATELREEQEENLQVAGAFTVLRLERDALRLRNDDLNAALSIERSTNRPEIERLTAENAALRADAERLDFVLKRRAFILWNQSLVSSRQCRLMAQDKDESYIALSGEGRYFNTERDAIDAARKA